MCFSSGLEDIFINGTLNATNVTEMVADVCMKNGSVCANLHYDAYYTSIVTQVSNWTPTVCLPFSWQ